MPTIAELASAMQSIAPTRLAEAWDNVGLIAGDPAGPLGRVMLAIDMTRAVVAEAVEEKCNAIVAYHPPIFQPLRQLPASHPVFAAVRKGIAIYSPHTALDAAAGGTNDVLADLIGMRDRRALKPVEPVAAGEYLKLVTFVPAEHVDAVSRALFDAGAGHIGNYSSCSFRIPGAGTFLGGAGSHPAVGASGRLETVAEIRLETLVRADVVPAVIAALRKSHPYEEVAFDLNVLAGVATESESHVGQGRVGSIDDTLTTDLIDRIKTRLGLSHVLVAGPLVGRIGRVAVCAGAGGGLLDQVIASGAGLYLTGELRHHDALAAAAAGIAVVCTLHSRSERCALSGLAGRLAAALPGVDFLQSRADADPFAFA